MLLLEFGIGQAESIKEIFASYDVTIDKDIEDVERMATVRRK